MESTVGTGELIFIDSMKSGLVPAKVEGYEVPDGDESQAWVVVTTTALRPGYLKGGRTLVRPARCVPRTHVRTVRGQHRVIGAWRFEGLPERFQPTPSRRAA